MHRLTEEQAQIVQHPDLDTHMCIVSCAGSGKTWTILQRVLFVLQNKMCQAKQLLMLTFTRNAAAEMQMKLPFDAQLKEQIQCGTFHSIAKRVMESFCPSVIRDLLHVDEYPILLLQTLRSKPDTLASWFNDLRLIIVDEYQDVNQTQVDILKELVQLQPLISVTVVGDDDQNIYSFRGSCPRFLINFSSEFQPCKTQHLSINFRCPSPVVQVANRILQEASQTHPRLAKPIAQSLIRAEEIPRYISGPSDEVVLQYMVREVDLLMRRFKVSPSEIAILGRTGLALNLIHSALAARLPMLHVRVLCAAASSSPSSSCFPSSALVSLPDKAELTPPPPDHVNDEKDNDQEALTLASIHAVKGLQYKRVYIVSLQMEHYATPYLENWRCFYVAVTRAQCYLTIVNSELSQDQDPLMTLFIRENLAKPLSLHFGNYWIWSYHKRSLLPPSSPVEREVPILGVVNSLQSLQGPDFIALRQARLLPRALFDLPFVIDYNTSSHGRWPRWVSKGNFQREFGVFLDYLARRMVAAFLKWTSISDRAAEKCLATMHLVPWSERQRFKKAYLCYQDMSLDWKPELESIWVTSLSQSLIFYQTAPLAIKVTRHMLEEALHIYRGMETRLAELLRGQKGPTIMAHSVCFQDPDPKGPSWTIRGEIDVCIGNHLMDFKASSKQWNRDFFLQLLVYAAMRRLEGGVVDYVTVWNTLSNQVTTLSIGNWDRSRDFLLFVGQLAARRRVQAL